MKKVLFSILFVVLIFIQISCSNRVEYSLSQPLSNIEQVEIVFIDNYTDIFNNPSAIKISACIESDLIDTFFADFSNVTCKSYIGDRIEYIDDYAIRVKYCDGACELIGKQSVYCEAENGSYFFPSYYFDENEFTLFINAYLY